MSFQLIKGPALLYGQALGNYVIHTKGDIRISVETPTLDVGTDYAPDLGKRLQDVIHRITFQGCGQADEVPALLSSVWQKFAGNKVLVNESVSITDVDDATGGICTLTLGSSKNVYKGQYIQIVGSSVEAYNGSRLVTADSNGTSVSVQMAYVSAATGTLKIPPALILHPIGQYADTEKIRIYQNAGITSAPGLTFATNETLTGEVTLSAVYHPYLSPLDPDALVRFGTWAAPSGTQLGVTEATILTAAPRVRYAPPDADEFTTDDPADAPWRDFATLNGVKVATQISLDPDMTDQRGTINWTYTNVKVSATLIPVSNVSTDEITDATIQTLLLQQDDGENGRVRGGSMIHGSDWRQLRILLPYGGEQWSFTIMQAALTGANAAYGSKAPRNGELTFQSVRYLSTGVPAPIAVWGTP